MWHKRIYPHIIDEKEIERSIEESCEHFDKVTDPKTLQSEVDALVDDWIQVYERRKEPSKKGTDSSRGDGEAKIPAGGSHSQGQRVQHCFI